jgi:6,7-dimethyl-8-ribityllumazine synthase
MIKGLTVVTRVASDPAHSALAGLMSALGFEPSKGWQDEQGRGAAFLAPVGNLELVTGRLPHGTRSGTSSLFVEVSQLDEVRTVAADWLARTPEMRGELSEVQLTHWDSRLFTLTLDSSEGEALALTFWQSENPLHGRPAAVEGDLYAAGMRFAIVVARWNAVITDRLLQGALDALHRSGTKRGDIQIVRVPGAWEIPSAARTLAELKQYDGVITLGCLLRGETAHYEAIYNEVARGIGQSQQETGIPHAFGVLTCETLEQALDRAGVKAGNKGFEAAIAAIEMISIQRKLSGDVATQTVVVE